MNTARIEREQDEPSNARLKIESYLRELPPDVLGVKSTKSVHVLEISHGSYNINYRVRVEDQEFIFRINIDQQSGLSNQIEYEFKAMKYLEGYNIAPRVFYLDNTKTCFDFGILIEEYLAGPHVRLVEEDACEIAELLVRLHSVQPDKASMIVWEDPLVDNFKMVQGDLLEYEAKETPDPEIIRLSKKLLARIEPQLDRYRSCYSADTINHTDDAIDNFIRTPKGLRLIDWEKPRIDDSSYDVCCFLCEPAELWCSPSPLSAACRESFLKTYIRLSGKEEELFLEKVRIREPIVSLHWILWGANKLCDLRDQRTSDELLEVHRLKVDRWERFANPTSIEKLLDTT